MRKNGFTLVELMISLTISAMLIGGMLYAFGVEFSLWKRIVSAGEKQQVANMVLARIVRDARSASKILPSSGSSLLSLKTGIETIEYSLAENKVRRKIDSYSSYLTDTGEIANLSFSYPASKQVEIKVGNFTAKASLRN